MQTETDNQRQAKTKAQELILKWMGAQSAPVPRDKMRIICTEAAYIAKFKELPQENSDSDERKQSFILYELLYPLARAGVVEYGEYGGKEVWGLAPACSFFRHQDGGCLWVGVNLNEGQKKLIPSDTQLSGGLWNIVRWKTTTGFRGNRLPIIENPSALALLRMFRPCTPEIFGKREYADRSQYREKYGFSKGFRWSPVSSGSDAPGLYRTGGVHSKRVYFDKRGAAFHVRKDPESECLAKSRARMDAGKDVFQYKQETKEVCFEEDPPFSLARVLFMESLFGEDFPPLGDMKRFIGVSPECAGELHRIFEIK